MYVYVTLKSFYRILRDLLRFISAVF